jgi:hypothetical protein
MPRSIESLVNEALKEHAHLISDMGGFSRVPSGCEEKEGFRKFSKLFCDSIILWGMWNALDETGKGLTIGRYIAEIRDTFNRQSVEVESVKCVSSGFLYQDNHTFTKKQCKLHRRSCEGMYKAGYIAIKVSLEDYPIKHLIKQLHVILKQLESNRIVLHDIDLTHDCRYISTRQHLSKHLKKNGIRTIIDDRKRVGDHCISWLGEIDETNHIRYKVYNKFVQMLESAAVRESLGSRIDTLVVKEGRFAKKLQACKDYGYTRLELTFYGPKLLSLEEYKSHMNATKDLLSDCTTFRCSFESQWEQRVKGITSMVAVYFPKKFFAYCHWWNSVTSKKCGYIWKKVPAKLVPLLLANYSFNDHPIYFIEVSMDSNERLSYNSVKKYQRHPGCTAITLVPGGGKGMFPSRDTCPYGVLKFSEVGIVEVDNIKIAWPKRAHGRNSAPLAEIVELNAEDEDGIYISKVKIRHVSSYKPAYTALEPNTQYTVVAAGYASYRQAYYIHFITECGLKIRAGKSLTKVWDSWRKQFEDR